MTTSSDRTYLLLGNTSQQTFLEKSYLLWVRAWQAQACNILTDIGNVYLVEVIPGNDIAGGFPVAIGRHCGHYKAFKRV